MSTPTVRLLAAVASRVSRVVSRLAGVLCGVLAVAGAVEVGGGHVQSVRTIVRQMSVAWCRTSTCIHGVGTEAGPFAAFPPSLALRCLCPNTRHSGVPVVTPRNFSCPTLPCRAGRVAACGSSTLTYSNHLTRSLPLCCGLARRVRRHVRSLAHPRLTAAGNLEPDPVLRTRVVW